MAWFRIDDGWLHHPKSRRAGRDGRDLWVASGTMCAKYSTDGWVEGALAPDYATAGGVTKWKAAAKALVTAGLWHTADTIKQCPKCRDQIAEINTQRSKDGEPLIAMGPEDFFFHEWWLYQQPKKAKQSAYAKLAADRMRALHRNTELCRAIQIRDRDRCRYCYVEVNWNDRRSATRPTYDHVDPHDFDGPDGGNSLDKVVVACATCNGRKGKRTPEEWAADPKVPGHLLRPPYQPPQDVTPVTKPDPKPNPDLPRPAGPDPQNLPRPAGPDPENLPGPSHDARLGSGRVGSGSGADPGLGRAGTGMAGLVRGGTGPGLDGAGLVGFGPPGAGPGREPPTGGTTNPPSDRTTAAADDAEDLNR
jgi:5-methylcytosine-specific restriction endonuclease McrA